MNSNPKGKRRLQGSEKEIRGRQAFQSLRLISGKVWLLLGRSGELPGKSGELGNLLIALNRRQDFIHHHRWREKLPRTL